MKGAIDILRLSSSAAFGRSNTFASKARQTIFLLYPDLVFYSSDLFHVQIFGSFSGHWVETLNLTEFVNVWQLSLLRGGTCQNSGAIRVVTRSRV